MKSVAAPAPSAAADRPLLARLFKFGVVGGSGVVINQAVLYVGQERLFTPIASPSLRLDAALALAIFVATVNNFYWNRLWTWSDRRTEVRGLRVVALFGQYALACWAGTAIQIVLTKALAPYVHYLIANLVAIAVATVFNFASNDRWTFQGPHESA